MGEGRSAWLLDRRFVAALVVLLVNDRYLKGALGAGPLGLVTGKLSDVAAMVVGPVLVVAMVPVSAGRAPSLTLLPPGLTLVAINLSAVLAGAYETVLEIGTGVEHRVVVDPTDLLGLVGLGLGWRIVVGPQPITLRRDQAVAGLIGLVAVMGAAASSQDDGPHHNRIVVEGDEVIAASSFYDATRISVDDGITWATASRTSASAGSAVGLEPTTSRCLTADPATCVRLPDRSTVEESLDGGRTWRRVWESGDASDHWLTTGVHGYEGTGVIELTDVAETGAGSVVVAASAIDPLRRSPDGVWRPSIADLRRFQSRTLAPLAVAVVFIMIGLSTIGTEPADRLGANVTVALALSAVVPGLWIMAALLELQSPWLPLLGGVVVVAAMAWTIGGRAFVGGLAGGLGILLVASGVLMVVAYFVLLEVIGFVLVAAFLPGAAAVVLVLVAMARGRAQRLILLRNLAIGLMIVAVASLPMAAWSAGWSDWQTVNQLGPLLALAGALAMVAVTRTDRLGAPTAPTAE